MTVKPIETRYAGCRFRSRLEARWAVFFDHMGIRWEYEPQGFELTHRLSLEAGTFYYLPDFWLPELSLWAEVKGSLTDAECLRLLDAAAALSSNGGSGCHDSGGNDLVVLGGIEVRPGARARQYNINVPFRLHLHKGILEASKWNNGSPGTECPSALHWEIASDVGGMLPNITSGFDWPSDEIATRLLTGRAETSASCRYVNALIAARSARFEHSEANA
jgi:hypothetical protein